MSKVNVSKLNTLTGHKDCIYTLEAGSNSIFFSGAGDGMVAMWDLQQPENGQLVAKLNTSVYALHYIKQSNMLVIGKNFDGIHLLDLSTKKITGSLQLTKTSIFDIKSHNDKLLVGTGDGWILVVDTASLTIYKHIHASNKSARAITINQKTNEFAVGYSDNSIKIFDLNDFKIKHTIQGHRNSVFTVRYAPDYQYLLSAGRDAHLKIWDPGNGYALEKSIVAHMYAINHIDYSPDAKYFVTCSMDKSIKVWHASEFKLLKVIDKARHAGHGTSVNKLLWSPYHDLLVSGSDDRTISIWDIYID